MSSDKDNCASLVCSFLWSAEPPALANQTRCKKVGFDSHAKRRMAKDALLTTSYVSFTHLPLPPIYTNIFISNPIIINYLDRSISMANPLFLSLSLCLLFLFNGCLAQTRQQGRQFGQCQLDRLDALEPTNRIDAEAGSIEAWDPNNEQFRCAGVAVVRRTIEPRGLLLPHYHNAPQLVYIVRGK